MTLEKSEGCDVGELERSIDGFDEGMSVGRGVGAIDGVREGGIDG